MLKGVALSNSKMEQQNDSCLGLKILGYFLKRKLFGGFIDFRTCDLWEKSGCLPRHIRDLSVQFFLRMMGHHWKLWICDQGKCTFSGSHWRSGTGPMRAEGCQKEYAREKQHGT